MTHKQRSSLIPHRCSCVRHMPSLSSVQERLLPPPDEQRCVRQRQRASVTFLPSSTIVQVSQPVVSDPHGVFVDPDTAHRLPAISCMLANRVSLPVLPPSSDTACQFITTLPHGEHAATLRNGTLARIRACVLPPSGSFSGSTLRVRRRQ